MHASARLTMLLVVGGAVCWSHLAMAQSSAHRPVSSLELTPSDSTGSDSTSGDPTGIAPTGLTPTRIDPTLYLLEDVCARRASAGPIFAQFQTSCAADVALSVRFDAPPSEERLDALARAGVQFEYDSSGQVRRLGDVFVARAPFDLLDHLERQADIARVEAMWQPGRTSPLEVTSETVGVPAARRLPAGGPAGRPEGSADGAGSTIALIDTGIDVLHPALFHADGGYVPWLDVNQNGTIDPGVDAVDLDRNGVAGHNETLRVLDATTVIDFSEGTFENTDGVLQVERDWLYADMNGDRERNVGVDEGFNEATPAYGEAIFVVDDADRSGTLDPTERLVRLSTSKIRKYVSAEGRTYLRGEDLIEAGEDGVEGAFHGTAAAGVLVGGQPPHHVRVGLAPEADLLVFGLGSTLMETTDLPLSYLAEAVEDGADVVLHEWTNAFTQPMDGSTNFEAAMQAAHDDGVIQINPVGNLNRSEKHIERTAASGDLLRLEFDVPDGFEDDGEVLPVQSIFGSLHWRGPHELALTVETPAGERVSLDERSATLDEQAMRIDTTVDRTSRGTTVVRFYLEATDEQATLTPGRWAFELEGFEQGDVVYGRISDAYSNWQRGAGWVEPTRDRSTMAFPATADAAFGVAAFAGRHPTPIADGAEVGELRTFSGRGPRLDGEPVVDIAAPDDPFVPLGVTPRIAEVGWGRSWFTPFGGTSGAAPHVAAAAALLGQQHPDWGAGQIQARLVESASVPQQAGDLPDNGWGAGKLDVYRALYGEAPAQNSAPEADVRVEMGSSWAVLDGSDSSDPDGDTLEFRFDFDYDGEWDTGWLAEPRLQITLPEPEAGVRPVVRVEVRDSHGAADGAAVALERAAGGGDASDRGDAGTPDLRPQPPPSGCMCSSGRGGSSGWLLASTLAWLVWRRRSRLA